MGWVNINESTNYWEAHLPFGGRAGKQSGIGRVGGRFALEQMTDLKTIVIEVDGAVTTARSRIRSRRPSASPIGGHDRKGGREAAGRSRHPPALAERAARRR